LRASLLLASSLFLAACGKQAQEAVPVSLTPAPGVAGAAVAPPDPVRATGALAAQYADIRKRAKASSECSLDYFRSVNFNPPQQKAILERGKFAELAADANAIDAKRVGWNMDLLKAQDDGKRAEAYLLALQSAGYMPDISEENQVRSMVLDAYYEAMGAPASCAVPADLLKFIGKS